MMYAKFGDPEWKVTVAAVEIPRDDVIRTSKTTYTLHRYKSYWASATFATPPNPGLLDAHELAEKAGTVAIFAKLHLALQTLGQLPKTQAVFDSEQVSKLTGIPLPQEQRRELPGQTDALEVIA